MGGTATTLGSLPPTRPNGGSTGGGLPASDGPARPGGHGQSLVGRERELSALRERIAAAAASQGGVAAIGGEPGIGKTRLMQAAAEEAAAGGAAVYWGHCYEGDWAPPYGPWSEILGAVAGAEATTLQPGLGAELGAGAAALAALVPPLRAALPAPGSAAALSAEEERFRLHEAAARFLLANLAAPVAAPDRHPALLLLDDLHWADRPSLALLLHLGRLLDGAPLLVVATYRDGALDRDHPLTETLAALRRESGFLPITLRGLEPDAVRELVALGARRAIGDELGRSIHDETSGNPFYVREVTRHLLDEGRLDGVVGGEVETSVRALGVPEGVRHVVGRRLARLSAPTRQVLEGASLFTAGVGFPVLQALTELDEEVLLDALDEAIGAQFLRPVEGRQETYDFAHAIVRQALVAERGRNPSRAARLHRRAAEAVAAVHGERAVAAAELAVQYHASAALPGAERGVPHALAAAEQANAAYAFDQSVLFLRIARDLGEGLGPGERAPILCRLATAEADALELAAAEATTHRAIADLRQGATPPAEIAAFLAAIAAALKLGGAEDSLWRPLVEQGLGLVADDQGLTWARLRLLRDPVEPIPSETIRAGRWLGFDPEAVRVARELGDEEDYARTLDSFDARNREETRAALDLAKRWSRPTAVLRALTIVANDLQYRHGAFREALQIWTEVETTASRVGAVSWEAQAVGQRVFLHLALGDFESARTAESGAAQLMARLGPQGGTAGEPEELAVERATAFALFLDGDWRSLADGWGRLLSDAFGTGNYVTSLNGALYVALAALSRARAGLRDSALELVDALLPTLATLNDTGATQAQNGAVAFTAATVWELGSNAQAAAIRRLALDVHASGIGDYPQTSIELAIARMAVLGGDASSAREFFGRARETLGASGQRPLLAIVDHDEALGALRPDGGERREAGVRAHAAAAAFTELAMAEWAARARELAEALAAQPGRADYPAGLSEREAEVLRLVARGSSDRQIADLLFVSPRTVNAHVRNLLMKTERANRTELSVWAVEHGLAGTAQT